MKNNDKARDVRSLVCKIKVFNGRVPGTWKLTIPTDVHRAFSRGCVIQTEDGYSYSFGLLALSHLSYKYLILKPVSYYKSSSLLYFFTGLYYL